MEHLHAGASERLFAKEWQVDFLQPAILHKLCGSGPLDLKVDASAFVKTTERPAQRWWRR